MEVNYKFPGTIEIYLDDRDMVCLERNRSCMDRNGFGGIESKVWLRCDDASEESYATIDGDGDLNIYLPLGVLPPLVLEKGDVQEGNGQYVEGIVDHYLGPNGQVIIR